MGQFRDISIKNVMEELNQSCFLPDIQREYVRLRRANEKIPDNFINLINEALAIKKWL